MGFSWKHEEIGPAVAHEYLAKSIGNRPEKPNHILGLAVAMESGKWDPEASEIVFDEAGAMIDGHHRLHAIIVYGKPVRMLVKRGVAKTAREVIDTNERRNIRALHQMFRADATYVNQRASSLATCIGLLIPSRVPPIRTLDVYDSWMRQFGEGIDVVVEIARPLGNFTVPCRLGPVSGAFAFAYKTNPKKVSAFMEKVRDGLGLVKNEPAHTLCKLLGVGLHRNNGSNRVAFSKKVLGAIYADLKGREYRTAQAGSEALEHFREAYDSKSIGRLVSLWTSGAPVEEKVTE